MTEIKPATGPMSALEEAGFVLMPLHRWNAVQKVKGRDGETTRELGKRPRDRRWPSIAYDSRVTLAEVAREGVNAGVRLRAIDLVIDWDPRNDDGRYLNTEAFDEFVLWHGLNPTDWPTVETGAGGRHFYLAKPSGRSVVDVLADFPGVEFKSLGRQVVAPGSIHPNGKAYRWAGEPIDMFGAPEAPEALLSAIERPARGQQEVTEEGVHSPGELEAMLSHLDPEDFRDQERWLELMMACHHATDGAGREEFVTWSAGDPLYADDAPVVGQRWDSLDARRPGGVTHRTLYKRLSEADAADAVPRRRAADDFDDVEAPEGHAPLRTSIRTGEGRLVSMVDEAKAVLFEAYGDEILQRHGQLVRPVQLQSRRDEEGVMHSAGTTVLMEIKDTWLRKRMAQGARWYRMTAQKGGAPKERQVDPPMDVARTILSDQGDWPFHNIVSLVAAPTMDVKTGSVVDRPGIDPTTGLLAVFDPTAFPRVERGLSRQEAERRLRGVEHALFREMPFVDEASRAVAMSALLCGLVRATMETCPMHVFDAAAAGTGKSMMADIVGIVAAGAKPSAATWTKSDEENEKRLASMLRAGPPVALFDNLDATRGDRLGGNQLNVMLTQDPARIRILGRTEEQVVNTRVLMLATGNNIVVHADACRRVVKCRMDAKCPDPERRSFDWDPKQVALARRGEIVSDLLSALASYFDAGRPDDPSHLGSFEAYTPIRGLLRWCGYDDPANTIEDVKATDQARSEALVALETWRAAFDGTWVTAEDIEMFLNDDMADMEIASGRELQEGREAMLGALTDGRRNRSWIGRALVKVGGLAAADLYLEVDVKTRVRRFRVLKEGA